jgi:Secretion system C-terminal sorting domain
MKKLLLSIAFIATTGFATVAQTVPLQSNWKILAGDAYYNTLNLSAVSSVALKKPVMDVLYVLDRVNGKINLLDVSNPTSPVVMPKTLTPTVATIATFKMNKIRVAEDGVIYATSLQIAAAGNKIFINRWSDHDSSPTSYEISANGLRAGDSFAVYGTGANTRFFIGGAGNTQIIICKYDVDGTTIVLDKYVTTHATTIEQARGSISAVSETQLWIESPTSPLKARKVTVGVSTTTDDAVISNSNTDYAPEYSNAEYFGEGSKKYLAVFGAVVGGTAGSTLATTNKGYEFKIFNISNSETNPTQVSFTKLFDIPAVNTLGGSNTSGFADVGIQKHSDGTYTFYHAVFGGGLASYTSTLALPVSLSSFNAALVKGESTITWSTASETNNKGFEVLRSTDGKSFSVVDFVASKAANGNSSTSLNYSYVDRKAQSGISYYRLKQIDLNGTSELFDQIRSVDLKLNATAVQVYPNPATSYVKVKTSTTDFKNLKYDLFDLNGKLVLSEKGKDTEQELSLKGLAPSVYYLKVSTNTEQKMIKIIKN